MNSLLQLSHYWSTLPGLLCLISNTKIWQGSEELLVKIRHAASLVLKPKEIKTIRMVPNPLQAGKKHHRKLCKLKRLFKWFLQGKENLGIEQRQWGNHVKFIMRFKWITVICNTLYGTFKGSTNGEWMERQVRVCTSPCPGLPWAHRPQTPPAEFWTSSCQKGPDHTYLVFTSNMWSHGNTWFQNTGFTLEC